MLLGFPGSSDGKESDCNVGDLGLTRGWEDPLEKGRASHSSILAWRIPWTEDSGRLQSIWGRKELDTTERLSLSLSFFFTFTFQNASNLPSLLLLPLLAWTLILHMGVVELPDSANKNIGCLVIFKFQKTTDIF